MSLEVSITHRLGAFALATEFVSDGGITALFGRSGAGKTSVIRSVAGLMRPNAGRIAIDGRVLFDSASGVDLPPHQRAVGYVFQDARLFPHLSVARNLAYGARFAANRAQVTGLNEVTALLDLEDLLERRPDTLSGGESQRVAIGRALLSAPQVLLLDEPLAALDAARKAEILPYFERLRDELAIPALYVSHSASEVSRLAGQVVVLDKGRVALSGPALDVLADPRILPIMGVREAGAVLPARVVAHDDADGLTELAVSAGTLYLPRVQATVGTAVRLRIDASDIILSRTRPDGISALNILPVTVGSVTMGQGPGAAVSLMAGEDRLLARITKRSVRVLELVEGGTCFAVLKSTSVAPADIANRS
jgi:molybdate transport system ATP-binding protein